VEPDLTSIYLQDSFRFSCSPEAPCFNECCRNLNQFLTPYDILRLKHHLGLSSGEFLHKYTSQHTGPGSGLPIVTLKSNDPYKLTCPFVTDTGCRVYENRPSSCRTYPLMRSVTRSRSTAKMTSQFMILKEPHCLGFADDGKDWTPQQWIEEQGIADFNENNDKLLRIISLKNQLIPGPLDRKSRHLFHTALYDLDSFRLQIFDNNLLSELELDQVETIKTDDVALLKFGIDWVRRELFGR